MYEKLENMKDTDLTASLLLKSKQLGFSDKQVAEASGRTELAIRALRYNYSEYKYTFYFIKNYKIKLVRKIIDLM